MTRMPAPPPALFSRLVGNDAEVWIVRGLSYAEDDPRFYAVSLIAESEKDSLFSFELVFDEYAAFCRDHGIVAPEAGPIAMNAGGLA